MEIILKEDVKNLGLKNDKITVANGYGRNYLLPQKMAVIATTSAKKTLAETIKQMEKKEAMLYSNAYFNVTQLSELNIKIGMKAGESGKIFGSITTIQIVDALNKAGYTVERKKIEILNGPINQLGTYSARIHLYKEVFADINFEIVSE